MKGNLLVENGVLDDLQAFENTLASAHSARRASQINYPQSEVDLINDFDQSLLPADIDLDFKSLESLRVLANFSQIELKQAREISSHRKIVGPFIVLLKKVSWPFVKIHLDETFKGMAELSAWTLKTLSQNIVEINELKRRVSELEKHRR